MSVVTVSAWRCDRPKCGHVWYTGSDEPPKRCAKCKSPHWNREDTAGRAVLRNAPGSGPLATFLTGEAPEMFDTLDVQSPEVHGRGKISTPKVVKRKPEQQVTPCRHGLFYHPGCNGGQTD